MVVRLDAKCCLLLTHAGQSFVCCGCCEGSCNVAASKFVSLLRVAPLPPRVSFFAAPFCPKTCHALPYCAVRFINCKLLSLFSVKCVNAGENAMCTTNVFCKLLIA